MAGLLKIQRLTEAEALANLTPYDDDNQNTTSFMFLDISDNYKLKGIFFDDLVLSDKIVKCLSCEPGSTSIMISNSVFVNTLGDDATGVREDFSRPFKTLAAAKNAALGGDTVVGDGVFNEFLPLHKDNVKWHFTEGSILNHAGAIIWNDDIGITNIEITGHLILNHITVGQAIRINNVGSTVNATFRSIDGLGNQQFALNNGSGIITINGNSTNTLVNNNFKYEGDASYTINVEDVLNSSTTGQSHCFFNRLSHTGHMVFNIRNGTNTGIYAVTAMANFSGFGGTKGTTVINVSGKLIRTNPSIIIDALSNCTVVSMGADLTINGNIDGAFGHAINIAGAEIKSFKHNGNAINNGDLPVVGHGQGFTAFWLNDNGDLKLNGKYESISVDIITLGGALSKNTLNGEIIGNNITGGLTTTGVNLTATVGSVLLDNLKIINNGIGIALAIDAPAARNVKVIHQAGSNVANGLNITTQINAFVVSALYE